MTQKWFPGHCLDVCLEILTFFCFFRYPEPSTLYPLLLKLPFLVQLLNLLCHFNHLALPELRLEIQCNFSRYDEDVDSDEDSNETKHEAAYCSLQVKVAVWDGCFVWNPVRKDEHTVGREPSEELVGYLLLIEPAVFVRLDTDCVDKRGKRSHDLRTDLE